jgi:hypothetical protein
MTQWDVELVNDGVYYQRLTFLTEIGYAFSEYPWTWFLIPNLFHSSQIVSLFCYNFLFSKVNLDFY